MKFVPTISTVYILAMHVRTHTAMRGIFHDIEGAIAERDRLTVGMRRVEVSPHSMGEDAIFQTTPTVSEDIAFDTRKWLEPSPLKVRFSITVETVR